jgi:hypothetical protein
MSVAPTLRKATRQKTKIRIGVSGPSGSGKTYSALLMASGITDWSKIALIDTENGSGDLYAHLGPYNVIPLASPFSPEAYIEAIHICEKAGMEVIVIDSVTHEWDGKGGCLESNDLIAQSKFKGNTWAAWSVTTPRHQKFIEAITTSPCHIITSARAKTDTIQTEDKKIKKVGMKEIQREGFEYELTINFTLDRDGHYATASKDRTSIFISLDPFKITPDTGAQILEWTLTGVEMIEAPKTIPVQPAPQAERPKTLDPISELEKRIELEESSYDIGCKHPTETEQFYRAQAASKVRIDAMKDKLAEMKRSTGPQPAQQAERPKTAPVEKPAEAKKPLFPHVEGDVTLSKEQSAEAVKFWNDLMDFQNTPAAKRTPLLTESLAVKYGVKTIMSLRSKQADHMIAGLKKALGAAIDAAESAAQQAA